MKLYQSVGPNPRVALMYLAESGVEVPRQFVDIMDGENRRPAFLAKNPVGTVPVLELEDGGHLSDSVAICEYLEETNPALSLLGDTAEARAHTRSVLRLIDQSIIAPMTAGFRGAEGLAMFESRVLCVADAAPGNKLLAADGLKAIDHRLAGDDYLCGARFSLADIVLFCFVEFGGQVGQSLDTSLTNLVAWRNRVAERPSAVASADPKHGMAETT